MSHIWSHNCNSRSDDEVLERFANSEDVLIELIKTTEEPEILNVRLVLNEKEAHDSDGSNNESNSGKSDSE